MTAKRASLLGIGLGLSLCLNACAPASKQTADNRGGNPAPSAFVTYTDQEVIQAEQARAVKVEVTCCAPVKKLLPDDTRGLPHQKFLLQLSNGTTILVAHDTQMAPRVPLQAGDKPVIHGEYIWNAKGGLIHWTHHTDTPRHEGGWILLNGQKYE
jgi:hypothetical protein